MWSAETTGAAAVEAAGAAAGVAGAVSALNAFLKLLIISLKSPAALSMSARARAPPERRGCFLCWYGEVAGRRLRDEGMGVWASVGDEDPMGPELVRPDPKAKGPPWHPNHRYRPRAPRRPAHPRFRLRGPDRPARCPIWGFDDEADGQVDG